MKGTTIKRGTTFIRDLSHESDRYLNTKPSFPKSDKPTLRIIPLGGSEEIGGRNMTVIEYGKDIIAVDVGLKFPEEDQPGIDYIVPNPQYLRDKLDNLRAVLITHGHMDHIGGVPQVMSMIGNPPIYATPLTMAMMHRRQSENTTLPPLNGHVVKHGETLRFGVFTVTFLHINHSIPDSAALKIETPEGVILHTGDFKIDETPLGEEPADLDMYRQIGDEGVMLLLSDSTGAQKPGTAISETTIQTNLDTIFEGAKGRVIAATFSSMLNRLQQIIKISEKYGRKVVVEGFSMRTNLQLLKDLGYTDFNQKVIISAQEALKMPPEKVTILCTGSQGEDNAALMRIANKEHRFFQVDKGDTIIFSSSVIPGNEGSIQKLKDQLARQRARIIHYKMMDVHVGGHAPREDLKRMLELIRPKYIQPIYGDFYSLKLHGEIAKELGMDRDHILLTDNGRVVEVRDGEARVTTERVPAHNLMVDGLGVGDLREVVIRDRQHMAQDGMITVIVLVDPKTGKVTQDPEVISKGFVYMKSSFKLVQTIQNEVRKIVESKISQGSEPNQEYIKRAITEQLGEFIFEKTQRRPMVLPTVIEL